MFFQVSIIYGYNYEINKDSEFLSTDILTVENNHLYKWPGNISY